MLAQDGQGWERGGVRRRKKTRLRLGLETGVIFLLVGAVLVGGVWIVRTMGERHGKPEEDW